MSVRIVPQAALLAALGRARSVALSAYTLQAGSPVVRALEACGDRHASVTVQLDGAPYFGDGAASDGAAAGAGNRRVAADLAAHGVRAGVSPPGATVHLKAAVVDGVAFLDDRNWPRTGADTLLATDEPADVALVRQALSGSGGSDGRLATSKIGALALEAAAIASGSGDRIDVESESFGNSSVSKALCARARAGAAVRVLVTRREYEEGGSAERGALARLERAGAHVRIGAATEKLCVAGDHGWAGSANASYDDGTHLDWGVAVGDAASVSLLAARFERNWDVASDVAPPGPAGLAA